MTQSASRRPRRISSHALSLALTVWALAPSAVYAQSASPAAAPNPLRTVLTERLDAEAARLDGHLGYCIVDVNTGERVTARGDRSFPTASSIKIAILYELFAQADAGRLRLDDVRPLDARARVGGSGVLTMLQRPAMTLADYATLMVVLSDNTATNVIIDAVGLDAVTRRMAGLGLGSIALQRRMMDADAVAHGRENVASPCDLASLLVAIDKGTGLSVQSRDALLAILRLPKATPLTRGLPAGTIVASKPGGLDGVVVDAGFVSLPGRPYVFVAMTNWLSSTAAGEATIEAMTRVVHGYFLRLATYTDHGRARP